MEDLLKVIKELQKMLNSQQWFGRVKSYGHLMFLGGIILVILNRFVIHTNVAYGVGFYSFLFGIIVLIGMARYSLLSSGLVCFGIYDLIFNVYVINLDAGVSISSGHFNTSTFIESLIYIGLGYFFFKIKDHGIDAVSVKKTGKGIKCEKCSADNPEKAKFCRVCGAEIIVPKSILCPTCSASLPPGAKFCAGCGNSVDQPAGVNSSGFAPPPHVNKVCAKCSSPYDADAKFCEKCGSEISC